MLGPFVSILVKPNSIVTALVRLRTDVSDVPGRHRARVDDDAPAATGDAPLDLGVSLLVVLVVGLRPPPPVSSTASSCSARRRRRSGTRCRSCATRACCRTGTGAVRPVGGGHRRVWSDRGGGRVADEPRSPATFSVLWSSSSPWPSSPAPAMQVHPPRFVVSMRRHLESTSQLPVRISVCSSSCRGPATEPALSNTYQSGPGRTSVLLLLVDVQPGAREHLVLDRQLERIEPTVKQLPAIPQRQAHVCRQVRCGVRICCSRRVSMT